VYVRIGVVYEAEPDFRTATELADRVLIESHDWLEDHLNSHRIWVKENTNGHAYTWSRISRLARDARIPSHSRTEFGRGEPDAIAARRAIRYLNEFEKLHGVLLIRDQDDQPERRIGLEHARTEFSNSLKIVIGLAIIERESWVISGFDPRTVDEKMRLETEHKTLGFPPHEQSHKLKSCRDDKADRSPKRVLKALTNANHERQRACWFDTPLQTLRQRGNENGLTQFMDELRDQICPLFGYVPQEK
jgi:hypothetical protein